MQRLRDELAREPDNDALRTQLGELVRDVMSFDTDGPPVYERVDAGGNHETWQDALRLQREGIEPARFAAIHALVLLVHGADDPHPGPLTAATLRPHLPQLEYAAFAECGHEPWRERRARAAFLRALFDWLAQHSP